jgi:hypothetical protein
MKLAAAQLALASVASLWVASSTPARADVPAFVDGPVFARACAEISKGLDCADCRCEAVTSTPSIGVTSETTDILHGILVEVRGQSRDGKTKIHEVRVLLGDETKLVDGGSVVNQNVSQGEFKEGSWEVVKAKQVYDMCPGDCGWNAVGMVHLFETRHIWREGFESLDNVREYDKSYLTACMLDDKTPRCVYLELAMVSYDVTGRLTAKKPKVGKKTKLTRTWKVGGKSGYELVLGKYSGNGLKEFSERSGFEYKAKTMHFADLLTWPDAMSMTPTP